MGINTFHTHTYVIIISCDDIVPDMLEESGNLIGLSVYTPKGLFVGIVDNLVMDVRGRKIDGLFVQRTNPALVERGIAVNVPYRWVGSVGDIVLLKRFPDKVTVDPEDAGRSLPRS